MASITLVEGPMVWLTSPTVAIRSPLIAMSQFRISPVKTLITFPPLMTVSAGVFPVAAAVNSWVTSVRGRLVIAIYYISFFLIIKIIWLLKKHNPTCSLIGAFELCYYVIL